MKIFTSLFFLFFVCILNCSAQEINTAKLDSFFNALKVHDKSMGSFLVARNGQIVYQKSLGYQSLSPQIPASSTTQYRIGSISKVFTATMIFQLIDEGKITLDTKLASYFPKMPNAEKITIGNLLGHSSGLMDYVNDVSDKSWITLPHAKNELLDTIANRKVNFEPGLEQRYSNSGYLLLGYILESITKQKYFSLLESRIVEKVGLKNTVSSVENNKGKAEARPYRDLDGWKDIADIYFPNVIGVGDLLSTPEDLMKFMNALTSGQLVSEKSFAQMSLFKGKDLFGMGLIRVPFYEQTGIGHNGGTYGSYSFVYYFKESGILVASTVNGLKYPLNDIAIVLLSAAYQKGLKIPLFNEIALKTEELDPFLGTYASAKLPIKITITKNGAHLFGQATGQPTLSFEAVSKNKFKYDAAGIVMDFAPEKAQMTLIQGGQTFIFTKQQL